MFILNIATVIYHLIYVVLSMKNYRNLNIHYHLYVWVQKWQ